MVFFAALCFCFLFNINLSISVRPCLIYDADYLSTLSPNIFLVTTALATILLNVYSGYLYTEVQFKYSSVYNALLLILGIFSLSFVKSAIKEPEAGSKQV